MKETGISSGNFILHKEIRKGELLPQLYQDFPFKQIYNPDVHQERLTKLFQLIFGGDARQKVGGK